LNKVRVEFSLEDMDMSEFQKGTNYEQIKMRIASYWDIPADAERPEYQRVKVEDIKKNNNDENIGKCQGESSWI
jgi:hypothetical protein